MDAKTAMGIVNRKSSIPNDGETFEEIENAYDIVMNLCDRALCMDKIISDIEDIEDISGWDLPTVQGILKIIHNNID